MSRVVRDGVTAIPLNDEALTDTTLRAAVRALGEREPTFAASTARFGVPPLWARERSFATLVHLILEQQVSLASALAAFERLKLAIGPDVEPGAFLALDDGSLREIGFSRQKAGYARELAFAFVDGFDLAAVEREDDDDVRRRLTAFRGIGRWTADVYLTMCLLRPDVWPSGDLALAVGARELLELPARPIQDEDELERLAERWRPYRAVAARIVWNHYLGLRGRAG
jgi:DNA-3-methyladenine glycosylase II